LAGCPATPDPATLVSAFPDRSPVRSLPDESGDALSTPRTCHVRSPALPAPLAHLAGPLRRLHRVAPVPAARAARRPAGGAGCRATGRRRRDRRRRDRSRRELSRRELARAAGGRRPLRRPARRLPARLPRARRGPAPAAGRGHDGEPARRPAGRRPGRRRPRRVPGAQPLPRRQSPRELDHRCGRAAAVHTGGTRPAVPRTGPVTAVRGGSAGARRSGGAPTRPPPGPRRAAGGRRPRGDAPARARAAGPPGGSATSRR
jgi:hypothetical protein